MSEERTRKKCSVGNYCETLIKAAHDRKPGIKIVQYTNLDTFKPTRTLPILYSGEFSKQGIVMNICPFCGGMIFDSVAEEKRLDEEDSKESKS